MAEQLPYAPEKNTFLDVLRTLAVVGGAGLSADPRSRPLGQMLTAGGLLMAQGQDQRRQNAFNSALSQLTLGESSLDEARRTLAESGNLDLASDKALREAYQARQMDQLTAPLIQRLMQRGPSTGASAASYSSPRMSAFGPAGSSAEQAGTMPTFLRGPSSALTADDISRNIRESDPAMLTLLNPALGQARLQQQQMDASALQHAQTEARLRQKMQEEQQRHVERLALDAKRENRLTAEAQLLRAKHASAANFIKTAYDPSATPDQRIRALTEAQRLGNNDKWMSDLINPMSQLSSNVMDDLAAMGKADLSQAARDPNFKASVQAAINARNYRDTEKIKAQRRAMFEAQMQANWNAPMGAAEAKNYIDPVTLKNAEGHMSPAEVKEQGYLTMSAPSQNQLRLLSQAEAVLDQIEMLGRGGPVNDPELAARLKINVGDILPNVYSGDLPGEDTSENIWTRMLRTGVLTWDALSNGLTGRRAAAMKALKNQFVTIISRGVGQDRGAATEEDINRARSGFPTTIPERGRLGFTSTEDMADLLFGNMRSLLRDLYKRSIGLNAFRDFNEESGRLPTPPKLGLRPVTPAPPDATLPQMTVQPGAPGPESPQPEQLTPLDQQLLDSNRQMDELIELMQR